MHQRSLPIPPAPIIPITPAAFISSAQSLQQSIVVPKHQLTPEENTNLHIFGLDPNVTEIHLYEAFAPYGAISSVRVIVDSATKQPKGYGFVQFLYSADADTAIANLNGVTVGSKAWSITHHKKKQL
jgi:RNA recognition motif-containing protein